LQLPSESLVEVRVPLHFVVVCAQFTLFVVLGRSQSSPVSIMLLPHTGPQGPQSLEQVLQVSPLLQIPSPQ